MLLKRGEGDYGAGLWCLPGGKVDYGECLKEAARRELHEETSIHPDHLRFLFYQDGLPKFDQDMHCIELFFQCVYSGPVSVNCESIDFAWVKEKGIQDYPMAFNHDRALSRYWET